MPLPSPPDGQVRVLLQAVWDQLTSGEHWPNYRALDRLLYTRFGLDIDRLRARTSDALLVGGHRQGGAEPLPEEQLQLTIAGVAACRDTETTVEDFLRAIAVAVCLDTEHTDDSSDPQMTADLVIPSASDGQRPATSIEADRAARQLGLLLLQEPWTAGHSLLHQGGWRIGVSRRVRTFSTATSLEDYWARRETLRPTRPIPQIALPPGQLPSGPMSPAQAIARLQELHAEATSPEVQVEGADHDAWRAKADAVLSAALGSKSNTLRSFRDISYHIGVWTGAPGEADADAQYFAGQVGRARALIEAAIYELGLHIEEGAAAAGATSAPEALIDAPIFIVHGRDDGRKSELARLLERTTDRPVRILHEQVNGGRTIIEKLERHVQAAGYAVVLLTGDDEGRLRGGETSLAPRGRQNVILELGVFIGSLGRSRVAVLLEQDVEQPSDLDGLLYIPLDPTGGWRLLLLRELAAAGIAVDYGRIP